jgi:hypothetical protein
MMTKPQSKPRGWWQFDTHRTEPLSRPRRDGQGLGTISYLLAMVRHLASADGDPQKQRGSTMSETKQSRSRTQL